MVPSSPGRGWNSLTQGQKIFIVALGALVIYGVIVTFTQGSGLGRYGNPSWWLATGAILLIALPFHEFAHAYAAVRLGDQTPRWQGRYTLNPIRHLDLVGSIMILFAGFGWAKPVMWNPRNITVNQRVGRIIVAAAGPLTNLTLAIIALIVARMILGFTTNSLMSPSLFGLSASTNVLDFSDMMLNFLVSFAYINVLLFVFNLLPIPPLDGSHILFSLIPGNHDATYAMLSQYGFVLLIGIVFLGGSFIWSITGVVMNLLTSIILPF